VKNTAFGAANRFPASRSLQALLHKASNRVGKLSNPIAEREKRNATPAP
jgi:hypothetical protein